MTQNVNYIRRKKGKKTRQGSGRGTKRSYKSYRGQGGRKR